MVTHVSMLRGINVIGKKVKMDELKELYISLGFEDVKTYIQSGNVVFRCNNSDPSDLRDKIENKIREVLGFDVTVLVRTKNELKKVIGENPFKKEDLKHMYVTFLSVVPSENLIKDLKINLNVNMKNKYEKFSISQMEIYLLLPDGYGRTKLTNNFFEKKLSLSATTRNWRTVNKLFDIAESVSQIK